MSKLRLVNETRASAASPIPFIAPFEHELAPGAVIDALEGTSSTGHHLGGIDVEGVVGMDHGALRIKPLVQPGWGRSAVTWGPFEARCGLVASVLVLNGHNASENEEPWPSLARFVLQWTRGTQVDAVVHRLQAVRRYGGRDTLSRRLQGWWHSRRAIASGATQAENLAVGLFGAASPTDRAAGGPAFVVRSTGPTNGRLDAGQRRLTPLVAGLQNVPLQLVVILREQGALYAAGSLPGAAGLAPMPTLRPLLIDPTPVPPTLFVGVHQAVLGQVGWGVDTRVHDVRVASPASIASWCTTAHAADRPAGRAGPAAGATAERGGPWRPLALAARRAAVVLHPPAPSGLVHLRFRLDGPEQRGGLAVRGGDRGGWLITASSTGVVAERCLDGHVTATHRSDVAVAVAREHDLQVLDDGDELTVVLDGEVVLGPFAADGPPAADTGPAPAGGAVGLRCTDDAESATIISFEAHPSAIALPDELRPPVPQVPGGDATEVVYDDDFRVPRPPAGDGGAPADGPLLLGHRPVAAGGPVWEHTIGRTAFVLDGGGALVQPVPAPPGGAKGKLAVLVRAEERRNAYTLPWPDPQLADACVTLLAPGTGPGQGQRGRGGLLFRQDDEHHLIVNTWMDDEYGGTSVSSFLRIGGFEDVYDAVWTNVGRRIVHGRPYDLRVAFDGETYAVYVDGEPVLYRRISDIVPSAPRLRIERVGIVSNWEFGDDTGTRFLRFRAGAGTSGRAGGPTAAANKGRP
ncbi:MAG: hypothetical protein AB7W59_05440 [Acidimicrobiia bacterium]